jgi:hypothetical protein
VITFLAHRFSAHLDAVGVVHQAVQDAVRDGGIPDLLVPARDRQLGSEDGGPSLVAIFADFPDFAALALDDNGGCRGGGTRFAGDVLAFTSRR